MSPCEPVVKTEADLVKGFSAEGVLTKYNKAMVLTDEELGTSTSLENKKTTEDVLKSNIKKAVDKTGVMDDRVLFCKSRLHES